MSFCWLVNFFEKCLTTDQQAVFLQLIWERLASFRERNWFPFVLCNALEILVILFFLLVKSFDSVS